VVVVMTTITMMVIVSHDDDDDDGDLDGNIDPHLLLLLLRSGDTEAVPPPTKAQTG